MTPFPGTPLYARLLREGRILYPGSWERCSLFDVNFKPTHMTVEELETGLRTLGTRIYNKEFVAHRQTRFRRELRDAMRERASIVEA